MRQAQRARIDPVFRFDADDHVYTLDNVIIPSVTQMLERHGLVSEAFYTEDSAERGYQVHRLCAEYDLGGIEDLSRCDSVYKTWLLAYVTFIQTVAPTWASVEEAFASIVYRFGGRPDRVGKVWGVESIVELKSGAMEPWHGVQTALHDILIGDLPVGVRKRYGLYLMRNGTFRLVPHDGSEPRCSQGRRDYDKAYEVIRQCAGR